MRGPYADRMMRVARPGRLRSRRVLLPLVGVLLLAAVGVAVGLAGSGAGYRTVSAFVAGTPEVGGTPVRLDTTLYLPDRPGRRPAVLLAQGFGGSKTGLAPTAELLAEHGYVALAYTARGFGASGGLIHFDSPDFEVRDARLLLDYLVARPQVDPSRLAVAGSSYGGGLALLLAAYDHRIKAVAADITWSSLSEALFPDASGGGPGVFQKLWAGELFGNAFPSAAGSALGAAGTPTGDAGTGSAGSGGGGGSAGTGGTGTGGTGQGSGGSGGDLLGPGLAPQASVGCGRFAPDVCAAYQHAARTGVPGARLDALMAAASPSRVLNRITAPTLLTQGEQDSLFPLGQADANARGIAAHGTPVRVVWRPGGHDDPSVGGSVVTSAMLDWFGAVFGGRVPLRQPFRYWEPTGRFSADSGAATVQVRQAPGYPGIRGGAVRRTTHAVLLGPAQRIAAPAGGTPAAITALPGLGGVLAQLGSSAGGLGLVPAQTATFATPRMARDLVIAGSGTVRLRVTSTTAATATLFVALRDLAPDGTAVLPQQLVAPVRLTGLRPGVARTLTVRLPAIVHTVPAGHRLVLTVATTDFAYQLPQDARSYTVALAGGGSLVVPRGMGTVVRAGHPMAWLITGLAVAAALLLGVAAVLRARRRVLRRRPELADVPVSIDGLVKEYAGGYRAVDDVSFRVERGQVVGLLGPNGAGKTTTLRVLVGLIRPTAGSLHVFGEPVSAGAPVLARLGAFIEGPGFLPHLSGRENLRLYWAATGRPAGEAAFETALEIAGLGDSIDRRVRSYSHGMKQRLGIAQAMLGLPELLVLDEPTNGLDPPQIAEMREVMKRYAGTGRTVVVSSHLLAEVEQTCTHVVVMHRGRLVAAGSVAEIAGAGGMQLQVPDPARAADVLEAAGISVGLVPARRALEDVFLDLIGDEP